MGTGCCDGLLMGIGADGGLVDFPRSTTKLIGGENDNIFERDGSGEGSGDCVEVGWRELVSKDDGEGRRRRLLRIRNRKEMSHT